MDQRYEQLGCGFPGLLSVCMKYYSSYIQTYCPLLWFQDFRTACLDHSVLLLELCLSHSEAFSPSSRGTSAHGTPTRPQFETQSDISLTLASYCTLYAYDSYGISNFCDLLAATRRRGTLFSWLLTMVCSREEVAHAFDPSEGGRYGS